ncbi:MAG: hypothetical protein ACE5F1_07370 [Planctomycetota bacterium]
MVRIEGRSDYDKLDSILTELVEKHGLRSEVSGWTRKTYDIYAPVGGKRKRLFVARVESYATTNGEIRVYRDEAMSFAEELGSALEKTFGIEESVIIRE